MTTKSNDDIIPEELIIKLHQTVCFCVCSSFSGRFHDLNRLKQRVQRINEEIKEFKQPSEETTTSEQTLDKNVCQIKRQLKLRCII